MESSELWSKVIDNVNLQDSVINSAKQLLREWRNTSAEGVDVLTPSIVCALFIADIMERNRVTSLASAEVCTLSDLLQAADIHIKCFFDRMGCLQTECLLHSVVKTTLKATKQKYCVTCAVYHKFQQLFQQIFIHDDSSCVGSEVNRGQPNRKHICWMLFLLAKGTLQQAANELVIPLQLLICCIDYTARLSPGFLLQEPFSSAHNSQEAEDTILEMLCKEMGCHDDISDVRSVRETCLAPILASIPGSRLNQGLEGLPELAFLEDRYRHHHRTTGSVDERLFLNSSSHLFVEKVSSLNPAQSPAGRRDIDQSAVGMTPVRRVLNSVQSLRSLLSVASDVPPSSLIKYFENCSQDPSSSIQDRIHNLKAKYMDHFKEDMGPPSGPVAQSRFQIGVRLYYRVMAAMLKREEDRLSTKDFSSLLLSDLFHKSLLGCAIEVVHITYQYSPSEFPQIPSNLSMLLFPWILNVFSLNAYDFSKVLESFVKDEPRLSQNAKKHLQQIEVRIIESLAWRSSSPLHDLIKSAAITVQPVPSTTTHFTDSPVINVATTAAEMYLSPGPHQNPNPHAKKAVELTPPPCTLPITANTTPTTKHTPTSPRRARSVPLNTFFNKVLQLAYQRLSRMCQMLIVSKELERYTWTCVEYCITNKPDVLRNRHLDQIIMSCIYAICKVTDNELKFKTIVNVYRKLPHAEADTYKNVDIDSVSKDSIIVFYNKVFMPSMKNYILQFQPKNQQMPTLSPAPARSTIIQQSVAGLMVTPNLYVSPLGESPFKSPQSVHHLSAAFASPRQTTPGKRSHYSFGEGPGSSEKLHEINRLMKEAESSSRPSTSKRLKFEDDQGPTEQASDEADSVINTPPSNGVSPRSNGHIVPTPEQVGTQSLPPIMHHRVAMMAYERNHNHNAGKDTELK